jgi:predicted NBD/HSP70 family sugar kinase
MLNAILNLKPNTTAPLDPGFTPAVLVNRAYRQAVKDASETATLLIAVERENGLVERGDLTLLAAAPATDATTLRIIDRHIKFLLWAQGGWRVVLSGPAGVCQAIQERYTANGSRAFDANFMSTVYGKPFTVEIVDADRVPSVKRSSSTIGGHLEGCRIGFDLGASDYKLSAVVNGEAVFSTEIPWHPVVQNSSQYHYDKIMDGLKLAASKMPRVDAIGGSSAGVYIANQVKVASLFRGVTREEFAAKVEPMFLNIQKEWNVPLIVVNDGDVTALAGAMSLKKNAMLGIAMGSSEAVGYLDPNGCITGFLNELAFAPVDFNESAVADEWSGDIGVGALYFSQQAVNKLAPAAGICFPEEMLLPERLKLVQEKADAGDSAAQEIFMTIGVYLGYTLAHYAEYYEFENLLILGRVTSGRGGEIVLERAKEVLNREFPEVAARVALHVPDEQSRRVGQAVAAASLPEIG